MLLLLKQASVRLQQLIQWGYATEQLHGYYRIVLHSGLCTVGWWFLHSCILAKGCKLLFLFYIRRGALLFVESNGRSGSLPAGVVISFLRFCLFDDVQIGFYALQFDVLSLQQRKEVCPLRLDAVGLGQFRNY